MTGIVKAGSGTGAACPFVGGVGWAGGASGGASTSSMACTLGGAPFSLGAAPSTPSSLRMSSMLYLATRRFLALLTVVRGRARLAGAGRGAGRGALGAGVFLDLHGQLELLAVHGDEGDGAALDGLDGEQVVGADLVAGLDGDLVDAGDVPDDSVEVHGLDGGEGLLLASLGVGLGGLERGDVGRDVGAVVAHEGALAEVGEGDVQGLLDGGEVGHDALVGAGVLGGVLDL